MSGLFATFNVAKRGISVQQKSLDVTSHNIANANTAGYCRQRANIVTTRPFGMPSMQGAFEPGQLGTGAEVSSITRIRDTFLDYQFRSESSTYGKYDQREKFLSEVEGIFNEPSDTGISDLTGKFFDAWQELSKDPSSSRARAVLAEQSKSLSNALNHASNQLDKVSGNAQNLIKDNVVEVNNIFNQVNQLNKEIRAVTVSGKTPNDLMDKRDLLLDDLSKKFNINIDKEQLNTVKVNSNDSEYSGYQFIQDTDDKSFNRLSYVNSIEANLKADGTPDGTYKVTYYDLGDSSKPKTTTMNMSPEDAKKLGDSRILIADKDGTPVATDKNAIFAPTSGELKGLASIKDDVKIYRDQLDNLAKSLAMAINAVHSGNADASTDDLPFFVSGKFNEELKKINENTALDDNAKKTAIKALVKDMEKDITSGNLQINDDISKDPMKIKAGKNGAGESDGSRALLIAQVRDAMLQIQTMDKDMTRDKFITLNAEHGIQGDPKGMKIDGYFKDIVNKLGIQCQEAKRVTKNQESLLAGYDESRLSVSGVSLDEEMANLIQFQHAYSANAKVVSTVDELLDVVINGLKR